MYGNFCILGMLKYGAGSRHATSQPLHDLCRDLHCHRDRYTWTSHPALEGTACGTNKVYSLFNHSSYTVINHLWEFREKNKVKNIVKLRELILIILKVKQLYWQVLYRYAPPSKTVKHFLAVSSIATLFWWIVIKIFLLYLYKTWTATYFPYYKINKKVLCN